MILMFTSVNCTWCDVLRTMIEEESTDIDGDLQVYEVDIEAHDTFADIYGVMMVPTLVSRFHTLSGVPCESDLRSFLLQATSGASSKKENIIRSIVRRASQRGQSKKLVAESQTTDISIENG